MTSAADVFVRCLENEGVRHVFGIPGEETLDLNEALDASTSIEFVPVRHEQGGAFMADAYGRLTGHAGVCLERWGRGRRTSSPASQTRSSTARPWSP
jgi:acetolactate synthase-1/2/3 large subunit